MRCLGSINGQKEAGVRQDEGDNTRQMMKRRRKLFIKRLQALSREYLNELIAEAAKNAELDRDEFWKLMKRLRPGGKSGVRAIRGTDGKAVFAVGQILEVWRVHFDKISTPKQSVDFDEDHYQQVSERVRDLLNNEDRSAFISNLPSRQKRWLKL